VVVALAALDRLGLAAEATEVLDPSVLLPQAAQGALGVECRADDDRTRARLTAIDDVAAHVAVRAERAYLAELGGGCTLPCGALATVDGGEIDLEALLAAPDGHIVLRTRVVGSDPEAVGAAAALDLLDGKGGRGVLE
jgi:hydroxymethylbilane synthase